MKGIFITLEGPDGSGKTTITNRLKEYFKDNSDVIMTREPGGTKIGEDIREIILDDKNKDLCDETEALLYAASRSQHIGEVIEPALKEGKIIISDRYLLSSLAYQGVGRELGIDRVNHINEFGLRGVYPDLILFFHIDPEETLKRKTDEDGGDRLEQAGTEFHKKVYEGYMDLIEKYPKNVVMIDASKSVEEVATETIKAIEKLLKER